MRKEILDEAIENALRENYSGHGFNFSKEIKAFKIRFGQDGEYIPCSYFVDMRGGDVTQDHRFKANKAIKHFNSVDEAMSFLSQFNPKTCAAIPNLFQPDYGRYKAANVRKVFEQQYNMYKGSYMNLKPAYHYDWVVRCSMRGDLGNSVFRVWLLCGDGVYALGFQDELVKNLQLVHACFCPFPNDNLSDADKNYFFEVAVKYDPTRNLYHNAENKKYLPKMGVPLGKNSTLPKEWQDYDWKRVEKEWQEYGEVRFFKPTTFIKK